MDAVPDEGDAQGRGVWYVAPLLEIEVPEVCFWFGGSLTSTEKREKYKAQAVEYAEVRELPGPQKQPKKTKVPAIRFICIADAQEDPNSPGYWMNLSQWNRFRNDTFKKQRADELPFILRLSAPATAEPEVAAPTDKMKGPAIKRAFTLQSKGTHVQKDGTNVACSYFACQQEQHCVRKRLSYYAAHTHTHTHKHMRQGGRRDGRHW